MRWLLVGTLLAAVGCRNCCVDLSPTVEARVAAVAHARAASSPAAMEMDSPILGEPIELPALWSLALAHNPALREAAADVESARGRLVQAGKYPNPRFIFEQEALGTTDAPAGTIRLQLNQEIVTGGKRRLDMAIATRGTNVASLALLARKYDVLTRIRRAYYEYLGWEYTLNVNDENVAVLQKAVNTIEEALKQGKAEPRVNLLRIQALLEEAKINQIRSQVNRDGAWRRLALEIGLSHLPMPAKTVKLPASVPEWNLKRLEERVLSSHAELQQAGFEVERARLEVGRARAEAVPNVQVGGGYTRSFLEHSAGAIVSAETALPLWDRKQGLLHEAEAKWARAQAALRNTTDRLTQDTVEAFTRYEGARHQVQRLTAEVLPRLEKSLDDVLKRYQSGAAQVFLDVLVAEESYNDTRVKLADARRELWRAIADLQGLMQLDVDEELGSPEH